MSVVQTQVYIKFLSDSILLTVLCIPHLSSGLQVKYTFFPTVPLLTTNISLYFTLRISTRVGAEYSKLLNTDQNQQRICFNLFLHDEKKIENVFIPACIVTM